MAAPAKKMVGVSEESSSSDDEQLRRCQEAVWETQTNKMKDGDSNVKESKRVIVADHEHITNELQVTQGFQKHVAKKLGHFLDSCISEMQPETSSCLESSAKCNDDDEEGFRLFSTSVPGQKSDDPPAPVRRRPVPSSSDSDSEMEARLKEAAVSVGDLLPSSTGPSTLSPPLTEPRCSEKIKKKKKKVAEGEKVVKKKKKRKQVKEESEQVGSPNAQSNGEHEKSEQEHMQVKVKRKKKER